jgi:hypothetical protein
VARRSVRVVAGLALLAIAVGAGVAATASHTAPAHQAVSAVAPAADAPAAAPANESAGQAESAAQVDEPAAFGPVVAFFARRPHAAASYLGTPFGHVSGGRYATPLGQRAPPRG